jgi:hypothetical protein
MQSAAQKAFWSYQAATETPSLEHAIAANAISANTTQQQWEALSPGMRREIVRSAAKRG